MLYPWFLPAPALEQGIPLRSGPSYLPASLNSDIKVLFRKMQKKVPHLCLRGLTLLRTGSRIASLSIVLKTVANVVETNEEGSHSFHNIRSNKQKRKARRTLTDKTRKREELS